MGTALVTENPNKLTNQELGQMKVLLELQKKEEKTKRIKAEVKALDHGACAFVRPLRTSPGHVYI